MINRSIQYCMWETFSWENSHPSWLIRSSGKRPSTRPKKVKKINHLWSEWNIVSLWIFITDIKHSYSWKDKRNTCWQHRSGVLTCVWGKFLVVMWKTEMLVRSWMLSSLAVRVKEPFGAPNFARALKRIPRYITCYSWHCGVRWIGLRFQFPIICVPYEKYTLTYVAEEDWWKDILCSDRFKPLETYMATWYDLTQLHFIHNGSNPYLRRKQVEWGHADKSVGGRCWSIDLPVFTCFYPLHLTHSIAFCEVNYVSTMKVW